MNLGMMIYQNKYMPLSTKLMNIIEAFNEIMICTASTHMLLFTDYIEDLEVQHSIGWSFVIFLWITIVVNFPFMFYFSVKSLYLIGLKHFRIARHKY